MNTPYRSRVDRLAVIRHPRTTWAVKPLPRVRRTHLDNCVRPHFDRNPYRQRGYDAWLSGRVVAWARTRLGARLALWWHRRRRERAWRTIIRVEQSGALSPTQVEALRRARAAEEKGGGHPS